MIKTFILEEGQELMPEQVAEIRAAAKREIQFDEDAPELSPALQKAFRCAVAQRNRRNKNA